VGRWVRLARRAGWPWAEFGTLMRIVDAESNGQPAAVNSSSGCAGLLQLHPCWYAGRWHFDPTIARLNLRYGLRVWRLSGWGAWVTY
jgi:soluble lytic murein transglycosylase-like protein